MYFIMNCFLSNENLIVILSLSVTTCLVLSLIILLLLYKNLHSEKKKKAEINIEEEVVRLKEQTAMLQSIINYQLQGSDPDILNTPLERRWARIKKEIDKVHNNFTIRLETRYNNLKEEEIQLCCLFRAEFDKYRIMQYLDLSKDYFRTKKSRLAKVLKVQNSKDQLEQFICEF